MASQAFGGELFFGRSNLAFAARLARELCGPATEPVVIASSFNDGEPKVEIPTNVRDADVYLVQSTNQRRDDQPRGDNFLELCTMANAARLASARSVTAVIPYFGCARQDRKVKPRTSITAMLACKLLEAAGFDRVVTTDLHAGQIQGFLRRPFDNLEAFPVLLRQIRRDLDVALSELVLVSPDDNGVERCRETGKLINCGRITFFMKGRDHQGNLLKGGVIRDPDLVAGRTVLLVDDMVDTSGSLTQAADACIQAGAKRVLAACVHGILSRDQKTGATAQQRIVDSPIERLYVTDTVAITACMLEPYPAFRDRLRVVSVDVLFAGALSEIHRHGSVSAIFKKTCAQIEED